MKKVFVFNSPPNSGKDVVANHLAEKFGFNISSFKTRLIEIAQAVYGVSKFEWDLLYTREGKETPHWKLKNSKNGEWMSPRQALIYVSEEIIKPKCGKDFFGISLAKELKDGITLIPDGGFVEEIIPLIEVVGKENVIKVVIEREGCTFDNDSRKDVDNDLFGNTLILLNNSSLENLLQSAERVIMKEVG